MTHHLNAAVALSILLLGASVVKANDKQKAKEHFVQGTKLFKSGDLEAAIVEFEQSVNYHATKNNLYNMANCYHELDRLGKALAAFKRIQNEFASKISKAMKKDIVAQIKKIESRAAQLTISTNPPAASIAISEINVGQTPIVDPLFLPPGEHIVSISLKDHETMEQKVTLVSGATENLVFELIESKAELSIIVNEPGVEISIDGEPKGVTPHSETIALTKGPHTVSINKKGFIPQEEKIDLKAGERQTVQFDMIPVPVVPIITVSPSKDKPFVALTNDDKTTKTASSIFIVGLTGTLMMAVTAAAMWGMTAGMKGSYDENVDRMKYEQNQSEWDSLRIDAQADKNAGETFNKAAVGTTIAAGAFSALMLTGVVLKKKRKEERPIAVLPSGDGVQVRF